MSRFLADFSFVFAAAVLVHSSFGEEVTPTEHRGSYSLNGRIHVGRFGHPDGKPLTTGPGDMKPSWSREGDLLVFFRVTKFAANVPDWKTAICVVKADGSGFRKLTDGTHTDFNPTWTRDGSNLVVLNRQNPETKGYYVMMAKADAEPGEEYVVSDKRYHTYAYSCLKDGRMLVQCSHPQFGYYLMTPDRKGEPRYEPIACELAKKGLLDRVSVTPDETKVCFEFQTGWDYHYPGRTLYIADFSAKKPSITNLKAIANVGAKPEITYLYPRWTKDQSAVLYHCNKSGHNQLYMYRLQDGSTARVSVDPNGDYMFPHGEATPK